VGADTRGRHHSDFTKRRMERYVSGERMTAKGCRTAGYFADSETQPGKTAPCTALSRLPPESPPAANTLPAATTALHVEVSANAPPRRSPPDWMSPTLPRFLSRFV